MRYIPQVDDYVKWKDHEGWVYFKCDQSISIELGVKDKVCHEHGASFHKKNHISLVCPVFQWHELEYVKNRRENNVALKISDLVTVSRRCFVRKTIR